MTIFSIGYSKNLTEQEYLYEEEYKNILKKYFLDMDFIKIIENSSSFSPEQYEESEVEQVRILTLVANECVKNEDKKKILINFPFSEGFEMHVYTNYRDLKIELRASGGNHEYLCFPKVLPETDVWRMRDNDSFFKPLSEKTVTLFQYAYNPYIRDFLKKYENRIVENHECEDLSFFYKMLKEYK